ncbi:MAG: DUF167 domain-containing protein [Planctomycetes bacterium]|nr:DUF167 domain-containing protein [Planctomycetota bacterium]
MTALRRTSDGFLLDVKVVANSRSPSVEISPDGRLRARVSAPARDGKANAALLLLLARTFRVRNSNLEIVRGASSTRKQVLLKTASLPPFLASVERTSR